MAHGSAAFALARSTPNLPHVLFANGVDHGLPPGGDGPGAWRGRLAVCATCDEYNGNVCEQLFPTGCCYGKWRRILDEPERSCPLKKW
jgi:hypothetical protein